MTGDGSTVNINDLLQHGLVNLVDLIQLMQNLEAGRTDSCTPFELGADFVAQCVQQINNLLFFGNNTCHD
ncbi:hypothetical protein D3C81_1515420 [compost metagenome]